MHINWENQIKNIYQTDKSHYVWGKEEERNSLCILYGYGLFENLTSMYYFCNLKRKFKITKWGGGREPWQNSRKMFLYENSNQECTRSHYLLHFAYPGTLIKQLSSPHISPNGQLGQLEGQPPPAHQTYPSEPSASQPVVHTVKAQSWTTLRSSSADTKWAPRFLQESRAASSSRPWEPFWDSSTKSFPVWGQAWTQVDSRIHGDLISAHLLAGRHLPEL